jgi:hypothetical protein
MYHQCFGFAYGFGGPEDSACLKLWRVCACSMLLGLSQLAALFVTRLYNRLLQGAVLVCTTDDARQGCLTWRQSWQQDCTGGNTATCIAGCRVAYVVMACDRCCTCACRRSLPVHMHAFPASCMLGVACQKGKGWNERCSLLSLRFSIGFSADSFLAVVHTAFDQVCFVSSSLVCNLRDGIDRASGYVCSRC